MVNENLEGGKKIVLAEDDKFISIAYKDGLKRAGFDVVHAIDGVEALKLIRETKPDLVLLDMIMPTKNGFEVLSEMKADESLKNIPVIVLSNLGQDMDIKKAMDLGAIDYMIKANFSMTEVVSRIKDILKI